MMKCPSSWLGLLCAVVFSGCSDNRVSQQARMDEAQAQVLRLAEDLDRRTTEAGVYERVNVDEINQRDPWGTPLDVAYAQGGVAETVTVRSAGPDRRFHTDDDILATESSTNFKGLGEGIKSNAEETAANVAKGIVKGAVAGVKETVKETLSRSKPNDAPEEEQP